MMMVLCDMRSFRMTGIGKFVEKSLMTSKVYLDKIKKALVVGKVRRYLWGI